MNDKLVKAFMEHEQLRGMRSLRKLPYLLKAFFTYLKEKNLDLSGLGFRQAQEYQSYLSTLEDEDGNIRYASQTVFDLVYGARCFYDFLKTKGYAHTNPFLYIRPIKTGRKLPRNIPKETGLMRLLSHLADFSKAKTVSRQRSLYKTHVMAELMYASGLRVSELAGLESGDIDFENRTLLVRCGKGGRQRTAYLNEYAAGVLKHYTESMRHVVCRNKDSARLFGAKDGRTLEPALNRILKQAAEACGLGRFTSHNFRHALGFHLLRRGCDMRYIQLILGHEDMNSTMLYTRVEKNDLKKQLDQFHPRQFEDRHEK